MTPFKIKNWLITDDGISWDGLPKINYSISKEEISDSSFGDREDTYNWLVHMVEKTWATEEDIYALNTAFIYAMESYELDFSTHSFVNTFIKQQRELKNR